MARMSLMTPLNLDVSSGDYLMDQELLPHSAPSKDQDKIAPWLTSGPADVEMEPVSKDTAPTPPPKSQIFGFHHKPSITSITSIASSSRTSRPSDTGSIDSRSMYGDTLRPYDAPRKFTKTSTVGKLASMIRKRSKSRLRPELHLHSSSQDVIPPLPSPDYIPSHYPPPPSPPPPSVSKKDRLRGKKKSSNIPPPLPPKDDPEPEFKLDTNLDMMEGIIDPNALPQHPTTAEGSSPSSGFESSNHSSGMTSDVSSLHQAPLDQTPIPVLSIFSNPFHTTPGGSFRRKPTYPTSNGFDGRKISPKTRPSPFQSLIHFDTTLSRDDGSPSWTAPESWAVEKIGEDEVPIASSDDEEYKVPPASGPVRRTKRRVAANRMSAITGPRPLKIRVHRANGSFHIVSMDVHMTVQQLAPQLNKKLLLDPGREMHRLYLKERGRERVLAATERPAEIVRRRLEQAGYDISDEAELGSEDINWLLKFVYKSNVLGPAEEDLQLDNFERVDLTGRSLKTIPVVLHSHTDTIVFLNLSRNPMLEIPKDFIESCKTLKMLRLSNMAMKKVPQSVRYCNTLQWLDLSCNRIADLDEAGLDFIPGLSYLGIQNNRMEKLPSYFSRLCSLRDLNISNNKFQNFPNVITEMTSLRDLDISFNLIQELPEELGKLRKLQKLIIVGNKVSRLPHGCCGLVELIDLDIRRNNISDMSEVCLLPNVQEILADHNNLSGLGLSLGPSLKRLDASHNDLTQLLGVPGPLGQPYALTFLDISHAKLSSLDDFALSHLTSLETLRVCNNSIRALPDTLGDLELLEHLACSNNQLRALPASIGRLQKLKTLEAHNNNLSEVPATLWDCSALEYINLTSNLLGSFQEPPLLSPSATPTPSIDTSLGPLPHAGALPERKVSSSSVTGRLAPPLALRLKKLYLGENRLSEEVLHPLTILKGLEVLNLSFNDIQEIPLGFLKNFIHMQELYLSGNNLTSLPTEDVPRLADLRVLFLNGNKLSTLPSELGKLSNLTILDVGSNSLKYNINNWEFDWNWNFNKQLRYLNFSGNKRLEIKAENKQSSSTQADQQQHASSVEASPRLDSEPQKLGPDGLVPPHGKQLAEFSALHDLKVLGLMDVTTTFAPNMPDDNAERRVRTSLSEVNKMAYGIADTLGANLNMFDLVQPEFRERKDEAVFAMFGRSSRVASSSRVSKYLHDHFLSTFSDELDMLEGEDQEGVENAFRRAFLGLNRLLHDFVYERDPRKGSAVSASGDSIRAAVDLSNVRSGASGVAMYMSGKHLYVGNVGNSLAVLSRQGQAELLSSKHDPFDRAETERIRAAEGWVSTKGRVNNEIEVSRSFGFFNLLPIINSRPYVSSWELSELDEFVIIGNQGLWDFVSYQTAVDIARSVRGDPMIAAQKLRDVAISYAHKPRDDANTQRLRDDANTQKYRDDAISYGAEGTTMIMVISVAELFNQGELRSRQPTVDLDPDVYQLRRRPKKEGISDKALSRLNEEVTAPTGHLAIVFTDIRNSTHLWEVNSGMPTAINLHNSLLRRQLRICGGYEVKTEGDAFMCSFPTSLEALWFCVSVQVQLLNIAWPLEILECEDGKDIHDSEGRLIARGLSVRMGIHQGTPLCELDPVTDRMDYFGPMVNRSARINGSAAGGQIMASAEVVREINAVLKGSEEPTELTPLQPPTAIEALRRIGVEVIPVGEFKLKGLELPEFLSAIYPSDLVGRHDSGLAEDAPGVDNSRVNFSIDQMKELALLCLRLETLSTSRVFKPLPQRKGSAATAKPEDILPEESNPLFLYGNLDVLLPAMDKATDADLMMLLDSLSVRIENALAALTLKQIVALNKGDGGNVSLRRDGVGMDVRTLQKLLSFLQV